MTTVIVQEPPNSTEAVQLITELEAHLAPQYPDESRHGYSIEQLQREDVAFFVMRHGGVAAGCGGVKFYGTAYGEIKRMYVRPSFRGLGLGKFMLDHLADYARQHGIGLLRLETGVHQTEAIGLYERWGFAPILPFGEYREDPLSLFYEKSIAGGHDEEATEKTVLDVRTFVSGDVEEVSQMEKGIGKQSR